MKSLILSCGGSPEPLIFCIENLDPDLTYFLCSNDSIDIADSIAKECNLDENQFKIKVVANHESLEDSFAKSREIIKELQQQYDSVHVDFTGGTKPMVSGLVLAAIGEECTYSYVGTEDFKGRDKDGLGVVLNGFEAIKNQRDPYDVFAVIEFNQGMDFFNKYQFQAAKQNFIEASNKLESQNLKEVAQTLAEIVDVYDSWDKFNNLYEGRPIKSAFFSLLNKIENSQNLEKYFDDEYPNFLNQFKLNKEFLDLKISRKGLIKVDDVKYYLPDLLNNAYRRIEEGKYDDAVARLYRTIELIAQIGLAHEGLIKEDILSNNKEFKINLNEVNKLDNNEAKSFIFSLKEYDDALYKGRSHISLASSNSYRLLSKLHIDYAREYLNDKKLKLNVGSRNGSILAHGLNPINEKKAIKLYSQVLKYAKRVFPELTDYIKMSEFPKFN